MTARVTAPLALVLALFALNPVPGFASQGKWGMALGGGKTPPIVDGFGGRGLATISAFRSLSTHLSVQTRATYLWSAGTGSAFMPVGLGVRVFADPHRFRQSGLFLEAAPSVFISRWFDSRGSLTAARPGLQVGGGFQIPTFDNAGIELGALYLKSRDFGSRYPRSHSGLSEIAFHAAMVTGF